jgi:hypothetical protein
MKMAGFHASDSKRNDVRRLVCRDRRSVFHEGLAWCV